MQDRSESARPLFVCGCARSGTSALTLALNAHPEIVLGMERYFSYLATHGRLSPDLFQYDRFFDVKEGDTFYDSLNFFEKNYKSSREKFAGAKYVGDKIPALTAYISKLIEDFPESKIICIVRNVIDVSASFENRARAGTFWPKNRNADTAVDYWNRSLVDIAGHAHSPNVLVVIYEDLFVDKIGWDRLSDFLGLHISPPALARRKETIDVLSPKTKVNILLSARLQLYRELLAKHSAKPTPPPISAGTNAVKRQALRKYEGDLPVVEYPYAAVEGLSFQVRRVCGIAPPADPDICILGSAASFGRFVQVPYADQLAEQLSASVANLAIGGARPETYLAHPKACEFIKRARVVVVEAMSARGYRNALFAPVSSTTNMVTLSEAARGVTALRDLPSPVFVDRVWTKLLKSPQFYDLASEHIAKMRLSYLRDMKDIIAISRKTIILYFSQYEPTEMLSVETLRFPHFISPSMLDQLSEQGAEVVKIVSRTGLPSKLINKLTGQSQEIHGMTPVHTENNYYPSQEMHDETALALKDKLRAILSQARVSTA
jgi:hypothetical protein